MSDTPQDRMILAEALFDANRAISTALHTADRLREADDVDYILIGAMDMTALLEQAGRLVRAADALNPGKP